MLASSPREPYPVTSSDEKWTCTLHDVEFVERDGFTYPGPVSINASPRHYRIADKFPNHIPMEESLTQSEMLPTPCTITYCEPCQASLLKKL